MKIPLSKPFIKKEIVLKEIEKVLDSKWISGGPAIEQFETAVRTYNNDPDGFYVACANASVGLEMALEFYGIGEGDEVIVPSWSWVATAFVVSRKKATPIWVDVNLDGTMDYEKVHNLITPNTRAIILVHQMGIPCDLDLFDTISKMGIAIIEDAACAFGSEYKGRKIGASNHIVVYSFQAKKCLTTGEGGMIVSHDKSTSAYFRSMRAFGTTVSPLERDRVNYLMKEEFVDFGSNFKISDIQCALGLAHLQYLDEEIDRRTSVATIYSTLISQMKSDGYSINLGNRIPQYCTRYNWQNFHVILGKEYNRDYVINELRKRSIGCKWDIQAIHLEPAYRSYYDKIVLPNTLNFHNHGLVMPFYAEMTPEEQIYVITNLKEILNEIRV